MKRTELIMGMPITCEIIEGSISILSKVFDFFYYVDKKFSTYRIDSEISRINHKNNIKKISDDMKKIFVLAEKTKKETDGYFDISHNGKLDPSGIVKGWAIYEASKMIKKKGFNNYYIEAGGDVEAHGLNSENRVWLVGIRNPFKTHELVKVITVSDHGVATSGTYERGLHIYNPKTGKLADEIASITVIGENILEADRFATAAFAMGKKGIEFIGRQKKLEGYMIDKKGIATYTEGFGKFILNRS